MRNVCSFFISIGLIFLVLSLSNVGRAAGDENVLVLPPSIGSLGFADPNQITSYFADRSHHYNRVSDPDLMWALAPNGYPEISNQLGLPAGTKAFPIMGIADGSRPGFQAKVLGRTRRGL